LAPATKYPEGYAVTMQITDDSLDEFMRRYRGEFAKDISRQDALEMATRVLGLYRLIYRPLPDETRPTTPPTDPPTPDTSLPGTE
jgi:hypothetical protein